MKLSKRRIQKLQKHIFLWWRKHRRNLPWRQTHNPYRIVVSEIMLQQTQVSRVLLRYAEFIKAFPTVQKLSKATPAAVLRIWKGMGYNRRALYLHKMAKTVMAEYGGKFPKSEKLLTKLPGLGTYTARAVLVFAYRQELAAVDTNIRKIITHFFFDDTPQKEKIIQEAAAVVMPKGKSWEWHQALMDYGALELYNLKRPERLSRAKSRDSRRTSIPFKDSNRFFRGRIIDMLREKDMKELELIDEYIGKYDRSEDFILSIIAGLQKDALVVRKNGIISLPE